MNSVSTNRSTVPSVFLESFKINRPQRQSTMSSSGSASASMLHLSSRELGCFSRDDEGQFVDDSSQRRIYCPPEVLSTVYWDLNHGYDEKWICRDNSLDDSLLVLLKWLRDSPSAAYVLADDGRSTATADDQPQQTPLEADSVLVCCRSLITRMLTTPYQANPNSNGWKAAICRYRGVLYANDWNMSANYEDGSYDPKPDMYRGFKFETYITAANTHSKPDIEAPVNNKRSLLSVVKTRLGEHTFVHMADVDCYDAETCQPIELKTCPQLSDDWRLKNFNRYKMMQWWAQCVLNGTEKVVCGFKNKNSVVTQLREYQVSTLPDEAAKGLGNAAWKVDECFKFCSEFTDYIKRVVTEDYDKTVYVFTYNPRIDNGHVTCYTAATNGEDAPLPSWFTGDNVHCRKNTAAPPQIRS